MGKKCQPSTIATFVDALPDKPEMKHVLQQLMKYISYQWFRTQSFDPTRYFVNMADLIQSGTVSAPVSISTYINDLLLQIEATLQPSTKSTTLSGLFQELRSTNIAHDALKFPELRMDIYKDGDESVELKVYYAFDCPNDQTEFLHDVQAGLRNFYQDDRGAYSLKTDAAHAMDELKTTSAVSPQPDFTYQGYTIASVCTIHVKPSFLPFLRHLTTSTANAHTSFQHTVKTQANFQALRAGPSVPYPVHMVTNACQDVDNCPCLYFVTFGVFECPGYGYYYNNFNQACQCRITRAVPFSVDMADRIDSKFGKCFDLSCQDTPKDCQDQCKNAQAWFQTPNWFENVVDPATVDIDLIEKTCGFKVPQFGTTRNQYIWTWQILVGGSCLLLAMPLMVTIQSVMQKKVTLTVTQIVCFLLLVGFTLLGGYAISGVQKCRTFGDSNEQAPCWDRLTGQIPLNHKDCDASAPIFCQCNPDMDAMKTCFAGTSSICKCRNNGACIPGQGADDMLMFTPPTKQIFQAQLTYLCLGMFVLVSCLGLLGIRLLIQTTTYWIRLMIFLLYFLVLFGIMVVFPVLYKFSKEWDQTQSIDPHEQARVCNLE